MALFQESEFFLAGFTFFQLNRSKSRRDGGARLVSNEKVLSAAKDLGYDVLKKSRGYRRRFERKPVQIEAGIEIYLSHNRLFDKGVATIVNLSKGGALIADVLTEKDVLSIQPFTVRLKVLEGDLKGFSAEGRMVRLDQLGKLALEFCSVDNELRFTELLEHQRTPAAG